MSNLPLYQNLLKECNSTDLKKKEKDDFIKNINTIDDRGYELIYTIIRIYDSEHNNIEQNNFSTVPYGGKFINNDVKFNLNNLPNKLKQMIYTFLKNHIQAMKEENFVNRPL